MAKQNIKNRNKFVLFATIGVVSLILILIIVLIFSGNSSNQVTGSFKGNINIQGETVANYHNILIGIVFFIA